MRKVFLTSLLCLLMTMTGCISTIQRAFDPAFDAQQKQLEIETMFPAILGFYAWLNNEFSPATVEATKALPTNVQFGYRPQGLKTTASPNCAYISNTLDYYDFFRKKDDYLASLKAQDEVFLAFCQTRGFTAKKYKFGFTKQMTDYFGLVNITGIYLGKIPANERYGYSYVVFTGNGQVAMIYTSVIYGEYSKSYRDINTYSWDAIFISSREAERFLATVPNSFLVDMLAE